MEAESCTSAPITNKKLWNKVKIVLYMLRKTLAKTKLFVDLHINLKDGKLARKAFTTAVLHQHYAATTCGGYTSNNIGTLFISPQKHKLQSIDATEPSPLVLSAAVSQELRVNESPLRDEEESQVDKHAEAFIKKFYKQLKQQHVTCVESPSPNHLWAPPEL